jgi:hypothetical protein
MGSPWYFSIDGYFSSFKAAAQARLINPIMAIGMPEILEVRAIMSNPFNP